MDLDATVPVLRDGPDQHAMVSQLAFFLLLDSIKFSLKI